MRAGQGVHPAGLPGGLLVLGLVLCASSARADFFSPGDLSRGHAHLEGLSNCTKCHEAGQKLSQERCLSCHTELTESIRAGEGLHGRMTPAQRTCETCHVEHHGRDASIVEWGPRKKAGFAHGDRTGFPLEGEHAKQSCEKCHEPRLIVDDNIQALLKRQPTRKTFLGLAPECKACHYNEHRGLLGSQCAQCHTPERWKPAPGFDHGKTDFPLEGSHLKVSCTQCHTEKQTVPAPAGTFPAPRSDTFTRFEEMPHASCLDCHQDPHSGRFGDSCQSCHTVAGWRQIRNALKETEFHDKTRFPLRGEHQNVACKNCHGPFPGRPAKFRGLSFGSCQDCHVDAHLGQLTAQGGAKRDCDECHSVQGFTPARFPPEAHARTRFPLEGSHLAVACIGCHREEPQLAKKIPTAVRQDLARTKRRSLFSYNVFDFPPRLERCESCHADPHEGQFAGKEGCHTCHQVESFHNVRFQHDRDSRFPLTGRHASVKCESCHLTQTAAGGRQMRFRPLEMGCASCHEDVHSGQFAPAPGQPTDCARCHETSGFTPTRFTHMPPFTDFRLEGKHAELPCARCHPAVPVGGGRELRKYLGTPRTCAGCHTDAHGGAFEGFQQ